MMHGPINIRDFYIFMYFDVMHSCYYMYDHCHAVKHSVIIVKNFFFRFRLLPVSLQVKAVGDVVKRFKDKFTNRHKHIQMHTHNPT